MSSLRIKLRDGRYLAYKERGVPKNQSKCNIIVVHGFGSSKEMNFHVPQVLSPLFKMFWDLLRNREKEGKEEQINF